MKLLLSGLTVLLLFSFLAVGQGTISEEQRKSILDYPLTMARANQLITALDAVTKYMVTLPDLAERMRKSAQMTGAEKISQIERDPKASEILKKNQLTAKEYVIGVPALRMALLAAGGTPQGPNIIVSAANLAFAKANYAVLKPKMDAADGVGARK